MDEARELQRRRRREQIQKTKSEIAKRKREQSEYKSFLLYHIEIKNEIMKTSVDSQ